MNDVFRCMFFVLVMALLPGCGTESNQPLKVGTNLWPGYELLYLARDMEYFDSEKIEMVELTSATSVMSALSNGYIHAAALTLDEMITLVDKGLDLRMISIMDISNGGDALVAQPGTESFSDLMGKRIGVEQTALGAIFLDGFLDKTGLSIKDIEVVYLPIDAQYEAFESKDVDAIVTFDPVLSKAKKIGGVSLFDSSQMPNQIIDVLVVREEFIDQYENELSSLVKGHQLAVRKLENDPEEATELMSPRLDISAAELRAAYLGIRIPDVEDMIRLMVGPKAPIYTLASDIMDVMISAEIIEAPVDFSALPEPKFIVEELQE